MGYGDIKKEIDRKMSHEPSLMCSAHGCQMKWSVDPGQLCSYHNFEDASKWPGITADLHTVGPWKLGRKREVDSSSHPGDPKGWAKRLKDLHEAGERLSRFQVTCYQAALGAGA